MKYFASNAWYYTNIHTVLILNNIVKGGGGQLEKKFINSFAKIVDLNDLRLLFDNLLNYSDKDKA